MGIKKRNWAFHIQFIQTPCTFFFHYCTFITCFLSGFLYIIKKKMNRGGGRSRVNSHYRPRGRGRGGWASPLPSPVSDSSLPQPSRGGTDGSPEFTSTVREAVSSQVSRRTSGQVSRSNYSKHSDHPPSSDHSYPPEHNLASSIRNPQLKLNSSPGFDHSSEHQDMLSPPSSGFMDFPSLSAQSDMVDNHCRAVKSQSGRPLDMVNYPSVWGTEVTPSKASLLPQSDIGNETSEKKEQFGHIAHDKTGGSGRPENSGCKNFSFLSAPGNEHASVVKIRMGSPLDMVVEVDNLSLHNTDITPGNSSVMKIKKEPCEKERWLDQTSHERAGSNGRPEQSGSKDYHSMSSYSARGGKHLTTVKSQRGKSLDKETEINTLSLLNAEFTRSRPSIPDIKIRLSEKEKQLDQTSQEKSGSIGRPEKSNCLPLEISFDIAPEKPGNLVRLNAPLHMRNREKRNEIKRSLEGREIQILRPGMILLKHYISISDQVNIVKLCRKLGLGSGGFYQPHYHDGAELHLKMMCLGRNWDPTAGTYGNMRPVDGAKPPVIPNEFQMLVKEAIEESRSHLHKQKSTSKNVEANVPWMTPDICIVNFYSKSGKLGLHQDKDESAESLARGLPVVSFSLGDTAEFLYGDDRDPEKAEKAMLESGDVLLFGGKSRRVFHGVASIISDTAPKSLLEASNLRSPGRLNLTFRKF